MNKYLMLFTLLLLPTMSFAWTYKDVSVKTVKLADYQKLLAFTDETGKLWTVAGWASDFDNVAKAKLAVLLTAQSNGYKIRLMLDGTSDAVYAVETVSP